MEEKIPEKPYTQKEIKAILTTSINTLERLRATEQTGLTSAGHKASSEISQMLAIVSLLLPEEIKEQVQKALLIYKDIENPFLSIVRKARSEDSQT